MNGQQLGSSDPEAEITVVVTQPRSGEEADEAAAPAADEEGTTLVSRRRDPAAARPLPGSPAAAGRLRAVVPAPAEQHPVAAYAPRTAEDSPAAPARPSRVMAAPRGRSRQLLAPEAVARARTTRGRRYAMRTLAALAAVPLLILLALGVVLSLPG